MRIFFGTEPRDDTNLSEVASRSRRFCPESETVNSSQVEDATPAVKF